MEQRNPAPQDPDPSESAAWPRVGSALIVCLIAEVIGMVGYAVAVVLAAGGVPAELAVAASLVGIGLSVGAASLRILGLVRLRKTPSRSGAFGAHSKALVFTMIAVALVLLHVLLIVLDPGTLVSGESPKAGTIAADVILTVAKSIFAVATYVSMLASLGRLGAYLGDARARRYASHATTLLVALVAGAVSASSVGLSNHVAAQAILACVALVFAGMYVWLLGRLALGARRFVVPASAF